MNATGALESSRATLLMLLALLWPLAAVAADRPSPAPATLDRAMAHYERCQWVQAFDELMPLADAGHREAARIALLMRAHGPRLFGHNFVVGSAQRQRWLDTAARPGGAE